MANTVFTSVGLRLFWILFLSPRETTDVQASVSVDQEYVSTCLRLYRRMRTLAVVLEKLPHGAFVLLTALHHPASTSMFLTSDSWLVLWESQ